MRSFHPEKLSVTFLPPATPFYPVEGRKYTLTHSDESGELFLSIGYTYDVTKINSKMRDEVIAEWIPRLGEYTLWGQVYVSGGEYDEKYSQVRFLIFQRELSKAIGAIVNGDHTFYSYFPWLLDAPIYIQFDSIYPQFQKIMYYGTPRKYLKLPSERSEQKSAAE
ncbi:staygreen family protein [Bacillus carboniphilus]|uniref:Staygreen family protein n=1 Tax=Bacillus carboniphilus TaxID=86663 RepID=A0ABN0VRF1_9BACI